MLYIVYDADGVSESPVFGVFTSEEKAKAAMEEIVMKCVEDCLADDPKESGLTEDDREWLIRDTRRAFDIQILYNDLDTYSL